MGYRIKEYREERRMTQAELAEKSGVSRSTIVSLESGEMVHTSTRTLLALADALGVSITDLFYANDV